MLEIQKFWKLSVILMIFLLSFTGLQSASAGDLDSSQQIFVNQIDNPPQYSEAVPENLIQKEFTDKNLVSLPEQISSTSTMVSASSILDTLKWVCKSALTLVGIGAWVTSVYYSGGMLVTVSNWVIRYITVPSLLCNWL